MIRSLVSSILVLFVISCASAPTRPSTPPPQDLPLWAGLKPGRYPVGFSATLLGSDPHPLQISVWYPSERDGKALKYSDYLLLSFTETRAEKPTADEAAKSLTESKTFLTSNGVSAASADALMSAAVYARAGATAVAGQRFPLVVVVQGAGSGASSQAILSELIASHGYVVVTIPSITRIAGPIASDKDVGPKAEQEEIDIDRAVTAVHEWPNIDMKQVSLVAHSFGARAALLYADHHPTVAFVSLEGGIGMKTGTLTMLDSKRLDLKAMLPPLIHFYELNDDKVVPDFGLLHSLRTPDLQTIRMNSLRHVHFSTDGFASVMLPDMATATKAGPDFANDVRAYAQQTVDFLDKHRVANQQPAS